MMMKRSWIAILTLLTHLVDQHAQRTIEYLKEENNILYHKLGKKRLVLNDQDLFSVELLAEYQAGWAGPSFKSASEQ